MRYYNSASGFEQITSLGEVETLTVPTGARGALIQAEGKNVRYRADGEDPTAEVGLILFAGDPPTFFGEEVAHASQGLAALKFIEAEASAKLNVQYLWSDS